MIPFRVYPDARSRSVLVFENLRPAKDERLARVVGRHLDATSFESFFDALENLSIQDQLSLQNAGDDFFGHVVFSWTKPANGDEQRRSFERSAHGFIQV